MSNINQISRVAFLVSAAISLAACSDSGGGVSGGGGVQVASDSCLAVPVANSATSYSSNMADLVDSEVAGEFQYSIAVQPSNGTVTIDSSTGDYEFTPNSTLTGARGFKTSFTYGVLDNGEQVDSGEIELIYGAKRIMPLGDSITYGVIYNSGTTLAEDRPEAVDAVGYRKTLYDRLNAEDYLVDFVGSQFAGGSAGMADTDHQGHPGMRANVLAASVSSYLTNSSTDIVLVHAGTNDLFLDGSDSSASTNVTTLVSNAQAWQNSPQNISSQPLTVIAAQIIPSAVGSSVALATIEGFNTQLANNLSSTFDNSIDPDFQVRLVDQYTDIDPSTDMTTRGTGFEQDSNGLHPNTSGYTKIANNWYDALIATNELVKCE